MQNVTVKERFYTSTLAILIKSEQEIIHFRNINHSVIGVSTMKHKTMHEGFELH